MLIQAYDNRANASWQQTRLLCYTVACTVIEPDKRPEIYDLFELPGDPTPEQRKKEAEAYYKNVLDDQRKFTESLRALK